MMARKVMGALVAGAMGTTPVLADVYERTIVEQLEAEGFRTAYDAIQSLAQNTGFTQNENFQTGFTVNAQVVNLRGMGLNPDNLINIGNERYFENGNTNNNFYPGQPRTPRAAAMMRF